MRHTAGEAEWSRIAERAMRLRPSPEYCRCAISGDGTVAVTSLTGDAASLFAWSRPLLVIVRRRSSVGPQIALIEPRSTSLGVKRLAALVGSTSSPRTQAKT